MKLILYLIILASFIRFTIAQPSNYPCSIGLYEENDFFAIRDNSDIHYTQGLRLEYMSIKENKPKFFWKNDLIYGYFGSVLYLR